MISRVIFLLCVSFFLIQNAFASVETVITIDAEVGFVRLHFVSCIEKPCSDGNNTFSYVSAGKRAVAFSQRLDLYRLDSNFNRTFIASYGKEELKDGEITISGGGTYEVEFIRPKLPHPLALEWKDYLTWSQYIYVEKALELDNKAASALAETYKPRLSFAKGETYFPIRLESLFDEVGNYGDNVNFAVIGEKPTIGTSTELKSFLSSNGNNTYLWLNSTKAPYNEIFGDTDTPIYWDASTSGDKLYITYYIFYGFDPKSGGINSLAGHALDRESFTIEFKATGDSYIPQRAIYAGHTPSFNLKFKGCGSVFDGSNPDDSCINIDDEELPTTTWQEKVAIDWEYINRYGNKAVLFIAKGAHAIYPTYGYYSGGAFSEPAGSHIRENDKEPTLLRLDTKQIKELAFSGYWIDALGTSNNRFTPFIGRQPVDDWLTNVVTLNDCFESENSVYFELKCQNLRRYFSQTELNLSEGLVAYYPFEWNSDDMSGNSNHGTEYGGMSYQQGVIGQAAIFNHSYIIVPVSESLKFTNELSYSVYVNLRTDVAMDGWGRYMPRGNHTIFAKSGDRHGYFARLNADSNDETLNITTAYDVFGSGGWDSSGWTSSGWMDVNPLLSNWIHIAYVVTDQTSKFYINGELVHTMDSYVNFQTGNNRELQIGIGQSRYWYPFLGSMDELRIYNRALSDSEILLLNNLK